MNWFSKITDRSGNEAAVQSPLAVVAYYQRLGFFATTSAEEVLKAYTEETGHEPKTRTPWDEVFLLRYDVANTWSDDPEADVCAENRVYTEVLPRWLALTKGELRISEIEEEWKSKEGPITLKFQLGEKAHQLSPRYLDDWIDLEILGQLNELIKSSAKKFNYVVDGNFCLVTYLPFEIEKNCGRSAGFLLRCNITNVQCFHERREARRATSHPQNGTSAVWANLVQGAEV